jgi:hypothetical protein
LTVSKIGCAISHKHTTEITATTTRDITIPTNLVVVTTTIVKTVAAHMMTTTAALAPVTVIPILVHAIMNVPEHKTSAVLSPQTIAATLPATLPTQNVPRVIPMFPLLTLQWNQTVISDSKGKFPLPS